MELHQCDTFQQKSSVIDRQIRDAYAHAAWVERERKIFLQGIREVTEEYMNLGVAVLSKEINMMFEHTAGFGTALAYFNDIAAEMNKPLVSMVEDSGYAEVYDGGRGYHPSYWKLTVPKNPRFKVMVASLLLVATRPYREGDDPYQNPPSVVYEPKLRSWNFYFFTFKNGMASADIAQELRKDWLNRCKHNPIFRVCLNVRPDYLEK